MPIDLFSQYNEPILFNFRRCPYAIRIRMMLALCKLGYYNYEILLSAKPELFLEISPKATIPVFITNDKKIIDESLDIFKYLATQHDYLSLFNEDKFNFKIISLIQNDFKKYLDRYKYATRFIDKNQGEEIINNFRAENFSKAIEILHHFNTKIDGFIDGYFDYSDILTFPFIRQFVNHAGDDFFKLEIEPLTSWLSKFTNWDLFKHIMKKKNITEDHTKLEYVPIVDIEKYLQKIL